MEGRKTPASRQTNCLRTIGGVSSIHFYSFRIFLNNSFFLSPNMWSWMDAGGSGNGGMCMCFKSTLALQMFKEIFNLVIFFTCLWNNHWLQLHFQALPLSSHVLFLSLSLYQIPSIWLDKNHVSGRNLHTKWRSEKG